MNIANDSIKQKLNFLSFATIYEKMNACDTLATSKAEDCSSYIKWPKFLGKGTYGDVWKIDETNVKKVTKIFEKNIRSIVSSTLKEVCFLSTFKHPHIRGLSRIERYGDTVNLIMPDAGKTLADWVDSTSREIRLHIIPYIVVQILSVLSFLEKYDISHGDLKPWNILIDENFHVSIIDWGAVCIIPHLNKDRGCTDEFAAPELMDSSDVKNSCSADIFSLGLIIRFLVYGKFQSTEWISNQCSTRGFASILNMEDLTRDQKTIQFIKKFQPLLAADPLKRPKASEIMEWKELELYRNQIGGDNVSGNVSYNIIPFRIEDWKFKTLTFEDRKSAIIWFFESIREYYPLDFLPFAVELMDQHVIGNAANITKKQLCFILLACFCISNALLGSSLIHSDLVSKKDNPHIFTQLGETIFFILSRMNHNIYFPVWNRTIRCLDPNVMLKVLINDDLFGATQIEKLAYYEEHISENSKSPGEIPDIKFHDYSNGKAEIEENA